MIGRIRDSGELAKAFEIQRKALLSSCKAFDEGERWEAIRIATAVHTLVHDGGKNNRSMLAQLGIKDGMKFVASGHPVDPKNMVADTPLVMIHFEPGGVKYIPRLDEHPGYEHRYLGSIEWWERDIIFRSGNNKHRLTRKKLTFALRNQEGGSHFDQVVLDPNYIEMTHGKTWTVRSGGVETEMQELELATMRQVGWEMLESLRISGVA